MFDYSALTIDIDSLILASNINLKKAKDLLVFCAIQEKAKHGQISPETIDSLKKAILQRMQNAIENNEFEYKPIPHMDFQIEQPWGWDYNFEGATASLPEVAQWARKAGIPIEEKLYSRICRNELTGSTFSCDEPNECPKSDNGSHSELKGKERQELERLRVERDKWHESIEAAVKAGQHCAQLPEGKVITKDEFTDFLNSAGHRSLPATTITKIWKVLPAEIKSKGGRPRGSKNTH